MMKKEFPENIDNIGAFFKEGFMEATIEPSIGVRDSLSKHLDQLGTDDVTQKIKNSFDSIEESPSPQLKAGLFETLEAEGITKASKGIGKLKFWSFGIGVVALGLVITFWPNDNIEVVEENHKENVKPNDAKTNQNLKENNGALTNDVSNSKSSTEKLEAGDVLPQTKRETKKPLIESIIEPSSGVIETGIIENDEIIGDDLINENPTIKNKESEKVDDSDLKAKETISDDPTNNSELILENDENEDYLFEDKKKHKKKRKKD